MVGGKLTTERGGESPVELTAPWGVLAVESRDQLAPRACAHSACDLKERQREGLRGPWALDDTGVVRNAVVDVARAVQVKNESMAWMVRGLSVSRGEGAANILRRLVEHVGSDTRVERPLAPVVADSPRRLAQILQELPYITLASRDALQVLQDPRRRSIRMEQRHHGVHFLLVETSEQPCLVQAPIPILRRVGEQEHQEVASLQRFPDLLVPVGARADVGARDEAFDRCREASQRPVHNHGEFVVFVFVADEDSELVVRNVRHLPPLCSSPTRATMTTLCRRSVVHSANHAAGKVSTDAPLVSCPGEQAPPTSSVSSRGTTCPTPSPSSMTAPASKSRFRSPTTSFRRPQYASSTRRCSSTTRRTCRPQPARVRSPISTARPESFATGGTRSSNWPSTAPTSRLPTCC